MRAHYGEPSGTYNLILTQNELCRLESTGMLSIHTPEIPCKTSRLQVTSDGMDFEVIDERDIEPAGLALYEYVGDAEHGRTESRYIQFLHLCIDREGGVKDCDACRITGYTEPKFSLSHDGQTFEGRAHFCPKCGRYMGGLGRYAGNC